MKFNLYANRLRAAFGARVLSNEKETFEICCDGVRDKITQIILYSIEDFSKEEIEYLAKRLGKYEYVFG